MTAPQATARFYHLTRSTPEATLPPLILRAREAGWRVLVRSPHEARLAALDDLLWLEPADGFLPHGRGGAPFEAEQPVLLTSEAGRPNSADCVILLDAAQTDAEEVAGIARLCVVSDGTDPVALAEARSQWKALTAAGLPAQYWSEESGRWQMKAERA